MTGYVIARNVAISPFESGQTEKREIAALRSQPPEGALTENLVIVRYVAISLVRGGQTEKREIASQARNDKKTAGSQPPEGVLTKERLPRYARNDRIPFAGSQ